MLLYKYSAITDYFKTNLKQQQIWFSPPSAFNDIDDSDLRIDWRLTDDEILAELEFVRQQIYEAAMMNQDFSDRPVLLERRAEWLFRSALADRAPDGTPALRGILRESGLKALELRRQTIGISCFSLDNRNKLLWAHYADSHRGVCLEIETDADRNCFQQLEAVQYVETLPIIKLLSHMRRSLIRLYTTKQSDWAYEREVRAFQHSKGNYPMDRQCLLNVFLGLRVHSAHEREIRDIVQQTYGGRVGIVRMGRDEMGDFKPLMG